MRAELQAGRRPLDGIPNGHNLRFHARKLYRAIACRRLREGQRAARSAAAA